KADRLEEELVDGVVLDARRQLADHVEHLAAEDLVPAEVALDVDAIGTLDECVPDRLAGLDAVAFHLVALGDDEGALVAQDADGLLVEKHIPHPLRGDVETVGVQMPHRPAAAHGDPPSPRPGAVSWAMQA